MEKNSKKAFLKALPEFINIEKGKGSVYFEIESNTDWNINVNNSGDSVTGLKVYPLNGHGNATIIVEYDAVETENYQQNASITVFYTLYDIRQSVTINIHRRNLPDKAI